MNKKIIITIVAALLVIGGVTGTVLGVQAHKTNQEYEALTNTLNDCKRMVENMNYVYFEDVDGIGENARQNDLNKINDYTKLLETKDMTDDQKAEFSEYVKSINKNFENDKNETKAQFDAVVGSKDSHTDEGYYTEEFNNEFNGLVNQFNELYNAEKYHDAFKIVLNMSSKVDAYVAEKDRQAEEARQAAEAEAQAQAQASRSAANTSKARSKSGGSSSGSGDETAISSGDDGEYRYNSKGQYQRKDIADAMDGWYRMYDYLNSPDREAEAKAKILQEHPNATDIKVHYGWDGRLEWMP